MINDKLMAIQRNLKAPKGQYNNFGRYNYRSCEDILEAVKPLLAANGCTLTLCDSVETAGGRVYIKATATLRSGDETIANSAFAREDDTKKGMDGSQITGTASSYARKYALNGLFCIDDAKDADTDEYTSQQRNSAPKDPPPKEVSIKMVSEESASEIEKLIVIAGITTDYFLRKYGAPSIRELKASTASIAIEDLNAWIAKKQKCGDKS